MSNVTCVRCHIRFGDSWSSHSASCSSVSRDVRHSVPLLLRPCALWSDVRGSHIGLRARRWAGLPFTPGLSWALWDVQRHPWPPPASCRELSALSCESPRIAKYSCVPRWPWLRTTGLYNPPLVQPPSSLGLSSLSTPGYSTDQPVSSYTGRR